MFLALCACKSSSRSTDTKSASMKSRELKLAFLKDYMACPSEVLDTEFDLVLHDNSGSLLSGPSDADFKAAVKVKPDHVVKWAEHCVAARLDVRPAWVGPLVDKRPGWDVSGQPDTYKCGQEERIIHVKEGVIFRRLVTD